MLKRTIATMFVTALLCLFALPVSALAAAPENQVIYVGGVEISSTGYWTTDSEGNVTAYSGTEAPTDNYIHYDAENNILTLHNATIKESVSIETNTFIAGAAIGVHNQNGAAELTVALEGDNTIAEVGKGIYVLASSTGGATLTITGDGSLDASARQTGIWVQSNNGNGALFIQNAKVEATGTTGYGVNVQSSNSSTAALTVDGGSLTASGSSGILYDSTGSGTVPNTTALTISNSAIVDARNGEIGAGSTTNLQPVSPSGEGIVFNGDEGTVYGNVTLQEDLTIGEGESLTLDDGASLNAGNHNVIVDGGTLDESLKTSLGDSVKYTPAITTESLPDGIVGTSYNQTLAATGSDAITWSVSGSLPAGLSLNGNTGAITGTPTVTGSSTFTVTAQNSYGSDSRELSVTISARATVPVTGVSLDRSALTLSEGDTARLTATVEPADATNQNVTWASSAPDVATVDASGNVTAVAEGTATITATTEDGGKTATCTVTVEHAHDPAAAWSSDASGHWHACAGCGEKLDFAAHSGKVVGKRDATCTEAGYTGDSVCSICGYVVAKGVATAATGHSYQNGVCTACGAKEPAKDEDAIPATGDLAPMACALLGIFGIAFVVAGLRKRTSW